MIAKFSKIAGFDSLVAIRGLKFMSVLITEWRVKSCRPSLEIPRPSREEVNTFETSIVGLLTQPKPQRETEETAAPKAKAKAKGKGGKAKGKGKAKA